MEDLLKVRLCKIMLTLHSVQHTGEETEGSERGTSLRRLHIGQWLLDEQQPVNATAKASHCHEFVLTS